MAKLIVRNVDEGIIKALMSRAGDTARAPRLNIAKFSPSHC